MLIAGYVLTRSNSLHSQPGPWGYLTKYTLETDGNCMAVEWKGSTAFEDMSCYSFKNHWR